MSARHLPRKNRSEVPISSGGGGLKVSQKELLQAYIRLSA